MSAIRSGVFLVALTGWTLLIGLPSLVLLPFPKLCLHVIRCWNRGVMCLTRIILRIRCVFHNKADDRSAPVVIAARHQSALDTFALWLAYDNPAFILKKELLLIPFFGWYLAQTNPIAIDRRAGRLAVEQIVQQAKQRLQQGRSVVIFPEGTRTPVGQAPQYRRGGITALYELGYPVVPVALNTGLFWPKRGAKKPGTASFEWLPALPAELSSEEVLPALAARLNEASERLLSASPGGADG